MKSVQIIIIRKEEEEEEEKIQQSRCGKKPKVVKEKEMQIVCHRILHIRGDKLIERLLLQLMLIYAHSMSKIERRRRRRRRRRR
jgi:uncharacterized protein (UPF0248 family)